MTYFLWKVSGPYTDEVPKPKVAYRSTETGPSLKNYYALFHKSRSLWHRIVKVTCIGMVKF